MFQIWQSPKKLPFGRLIWTLVLGFSNLAMSKISDLAKYLKIFKTIFAHNPFQVILTKFMKIFKKMFCPESFSDHFKNNPIFSPTENFEHLLEVH